MAKINVNNISDELFSKTPETGSFKEDRPVQNQTSLLRPYKIVVADDDEEIHHVTDMILKGFLFEGHPLEIIDTYTAAQTIDVFRTTQNIAILFLDVVMEKDCSGLDVVKKIRNDMDNYSTRIILRTGQPGEAPEEEVIREYDLNDYRLKTELTASRLKTTLFSSLRNYRDIQSLEKHKSGLEKIIRTTSKLFENKTIKDFLTSILEELSNFHKDSPEMLYVHGAQPDLSEGFVTIEEKKRNLIVAATGKFESYIGQEVEVIPELMHLKHWMRDNEEEKIIHKLEEGFIIESRGNSQLHNFIYIEGNWEAFDIELIQLFLSNFSVALDNFLLSNMLNSTQKDMVIALGETLECHFEETGSHVKRISEMMYQFALSNGVSPAESELVKIASSMHDLGKIAIPDAILKKPGRLTPEEFDIIKTHSMHGYNILSKSDVPFLKMAAEIALNHHERYDGTGYPNHLAEQNIPLYARMMAIVDVFDAMTHKRIYKDALCAEEAMKYLKESKGTHFDPELVDLFADNLEQIITDTRDI
jgi:response regulator RpfG family c-di-GMP phosphodiesterase